MRTMRVRVLTLLTLSTLALTACQTTGSGATKTWVCEVFRPISWSQHDTLDTQKEIVSHNAAYVSLCGKPK